MTVSREDDRATGEVTVTAWLCANCSCSDQALGPASQPGPRPEFDWTFPVREMLVPCTGRLQPEHVLKAFEAGAGLVVTVSCGDDACLYGQGAERWSRRVDYLRDLLDEIGLGRERLLHFRLTGGATDSRASITAAVAQALENLSPNPLHIDPFEGAALELYEGSDMSDDNED